MCRLRAEEGRFAAAETATSGGAEKQRFAFFGQEISSIVQEEAVLWKNPA
jgi:hypothetical protein